MLDRFRTPALRTLVGTYVCLRVLEADHRARSVPDGVDRDGVANYITYALQVVTAAHLRAWPLDGPTLLTCEDVWSQRWHGRLRGLGGDRESRLKWALSLTAWLQRRFLGADQWPASPDLAAVADAVDNLANCLHFRLRHGVATVLLVQRLWEGADPAALASSDEDERRTAKALAECSLLVQVE